MIVPVGTQNYLKMIIEIALQDDPEIVLTYQDIADRASLSRPTVVRNLIPLVKCGVIERESAGFRGGGRGWGFIYRIANHE